MKNIGHGRVEHFCTGIWNCILNRRWRLLYKLRCSMYPAQNSMLYLDTAMGVVLIFYRETRVQRNRRSVVTVLSNCRNEQGRHDICQFFYFFIFSGQKLVGNIFHCFAFQNYVWSFVSHFLLSCIAFLARRFLRKKYIPIFKSCTELEIVKKGLPKKVSPLAWCTWFLGCFYWKYPCLGKILGHVKPL